MTCPVRTFGKLEGLGRPGPGLNTRLSLQDWRPKSGRDAKGNQEVPCAWGENSGKGAALVSPAEWRFLLGLKQLLPAYRYDLSYFAKNRRSSEEIKALASSLSSGCPLASRSDKTE